MKSIASIDFSILEPVTLDVTSALQGFQCDRGEFRTFLKERVPRDVERSICQCWVLRAGMRIGGYITLLSDRLSIDDKRVLANENIPYDSFPAVKIGLLASDKRLKGKGIGKRLVIWSINHVLSNVRSNVGVRFITVDALCDKDNNYDASGFYQQLGFEFTHPELEQPLYRPWKSMYLDLMPFIEALQKEPLSR
jgi:GNAT superfamily N-acetyltransferase